MFSCFGPSKLEALHHDIDSLKLLLQTKENELERLRRQEAAQKLKEEQQTEALQAAAAHVAQLEARLIEHQRVSKDLEAQLRAEVEQKLAACQLQGDKQRIALESELQSVRQQLGDQQLVHDGQRKQYEAAMLEQKQKLERISEKARQVELQRQLLEVRLQEEHQKRLEQERLVEKQNAEHSKLLRRLAAEEHRARRFQKQIANFTETMEEVSNILTAVEHDQKTVTSPIKVDSRKAKTSVAADQLRQSIALFKRNKDEQGTDQGEPHESA